jgi:hypothetical protein
VNRSLFWLSPRAGEEGRLVAVNKDVLRDIITRHIISLRLVNRASTNDPLWEIEYIRSTFRSWQTRASDPISRSSST